MDMITIALSYEKAPELFRPALPYWRELADAVWRQALNIRDQYDVTETPEPTAYASAEALFADLDSGRITVSRANSNHPVFSVEENVAFRLAHDVLGHYAARNARQPAQFDWLGEQTACRFHGFELRTGLVRAALFTEVVGQAAYALHHGTFAVQKVAFL